MQLKQIMKIKENFIKLCLTFIGTKNWTCEIDTATRLLVIKQK